MNHRGPALVAASVFAVSAGISYASGNDHTVYEADVMIGVSAPYTGPINAICGVPGGVARWVIADAEINLRASGSVDVEVEGLVLGPTGPAAIAGTNPVASQKVIVSCLSTDASGAPTTVNASSETFTVDPVGNGAARVHVALPSPCIAPIVFVASGGGSWFAASGA